VNRRPPPDALTVTQLARRVRGVLEGSFDRVWVKGEISNFRRFNSGHWYFTLKDSGAQLKAAMFGRDNRYVRFEPRDGDEVIVQGRIDLYDRRGDLQVVASWMEPVGAGRLQKQLKELEAKLRAEGLFDPARKQPLPRVPRRIGIVTSRQAAALQDMLRILAERDPTLSITIAPCRVQGAEAGPEVAAALRLLARHGDVEVILCGRGGGSLEDLWAFNTEVVVRAIADCPIPVVTGIGHEIDTTLADLAADARAPTPTGAAEMACLARADLEAGVDGLKRRLADAVRRALDRRARRAADLETRLPTPARRLDAAGQRLDDARGRLARAASNTLIRRRDRLGAARRALDVLGPMQSLERGYAIVTRGEGGAPVVREAAQVVPGDPVRVRLFRGALECTVDSVVDGADLDLRGRPAR